MSIGISEPDRRLGLAEANHRFLNTLSALDGLLRRDFDAFADPIVGDAVRRFSSRLHAFADVHRTLGEPGGEATVDAPARLARLCAELCEAHLAPRGLYCEFTSDPGFLPRETCQTLSLIVVELVTNAVKHAFAGRGWGRVRIALRRTATSWICVVADNGSGFGGGPAGDGLKLVRGLAAQLNADLRVHSDAGGVTVFLRLPDDPTVLQADAARRPCQA